MFASDLLDDEDYRIAHLRDHASSGLSVAEYCRRHGVCVATFYTWRRRFGNDVGGNSQVSFTEIGRMDAAPSHWAAEVELASGSVIRLSRDADAGFVRMLLGVVS